MSKAVLIRLEGVMAHFRDPRYNTGSVSKTGILPLRTLRCPPPSTIHGLICAAAGAWVEPETLVLGWRMEFASIGTDFQTCRIPKRNSNGEQVGVEQTPRVREFLAFPLLSIIAFEGVHSEWFRRPVNPLSLGRSEDLIIGTERVLVDFAPRNTGTIQGQCLPIGYGYGTLYSAPLYYTSDRRPIAMSPKTDAFAPQEVTSPNLVQVTDEASSYFVWRFHNAVSQE